MFIDELFHFTLFPEAAGTTSQPGSLALYPVNDAYANRTHVYV